MKNLLFFASTIIVATSMFSCTNVTETASEENIAFISEGNSNDLLNKIDKINEKYQTTKAPLTKNKDETARKWGGRIFSAVVDGIGGYIAGPAGWLVGPLCSWAYEEHWNRCTRDIKPTTTTRPKKISARDSSMVPTYVVANKEYLTHIDSIGYYHNLILDKLSQTNNNYFNSDSTINYKLIYTDCEKASKELSLDIPKTEEKEKLISLSEFIVERIAKCYDENDLNKAFDDINQYYNREFNLDETLIITEKIQRKIISAIKDINNEDNLKQYANEIYDAIFSSGVSPDLKEKASVANTVTINSKLYWDKAPETCETHK